jgi:hypothetical protein
MNKTKSVFLAVALPVLAFGVYGAVIQNSPQARADVAAKLAGDEAYFNDMLGNPNDAGHSRACSAARALEQDYKVLGRSADAHMMFDAEVNIGC